MKMRMALILFTLLSTVVAARAEHARIDLQIMHRDPTTGQMKTVASSAMDQEPPPGGHQARPLARLKANEPLVLQFLFDNLYPHKVIPNARVRYFVVPIEKVGQKTLPDLSKDVVTQGKFTLNFKPKGRVGARVSFTITKPGTYLLRVQSENTDSDHEHFSSIDLVVE